MRLDFEPGLTERYTSLRDCMATCIYKRGLSTCAIDLDESPGNLSNKLSENPNRHFNIQDFERYLEKSRDPTPIYYLAERFLSDKSARTDAASVEVLQALTSLMPLLKRAGLT
ncbi:MAG: hypothetical protein EPN62_00945 [Candidimonas sp.]|nr:MAG: hypothetical protein EPN77_01945 [Candidimonas sp.]TAM26904.1 MAG: hypothetical protein EPN62_00945 [Candidimonas sp.]